MRLVLAAALSALFWAAPAQATGGMRCAPVSGRGPVVAFGFPHAIVAPLISASIEDGPLTLRTGALVETPTLRSLVVGQSWIDRERIMIDFVDDQLLRFEGKLRASFPRRGGAAVGTFVRNGRTWRVRCEEA